MITSSKQHSIVIASHSLDEAITHCVLTQPELAAKIKVVTLAQLRSEFSICDKLSDTCQSINWYKNASVYISNSNHLLLNRVLYVPNTLFTDFAPIDQEYAQREFEAYLGFAFNSFKGVGNDSAMGICGDTLALPQQWDYASKNFDLAIPNYYWGPKAANPLSMQPNIVNSTIYNFLNWQPGSCTESDHQFCFEKPRGEPVFILKVGKQHLITSSQPLSPTLQQQLKTLTSSFNPFICETLIFLDQDHLTFGCINLEILRSTHNPNFPNFIKTHLVDEFYQCLN
jgi:hypothetical protein